MHHRCGSGPIGPGLRLRTGGRRGRAWSGIPREDRGRGGDVQWRPQAYGPRQRGRADVTVSRCTSETERLREVEEEPVLVVVLHL
jgi:hypothetical protein